MERFKPAKNVPISKDHHSIPSISSPATLSLINCPQCSRLSQLQPGSKCSKQNSVRTFCLNFTCKKCAKDGQLGTCHSKSRCTFWNTKCKSASQERSSSNWPPEKLQILWNAKISSFVFFVCQGTLLDVNMVVAICFQENRNRRLNWKKNQKKPKQSLLCSHVELVHQDVMKNNGQSVGHESNKQVWYDNVLEQKNVLTSVWGLLTSCLRAQRNLMLIQWISRTWLWVNFDKGSYRKNPCNMQIHQTLSPLWW